MLHAIQPRVIDMACYWIYIVGRISGALFAVGIAFLLSGRGIGISAAQGRTEEIVAENSEQPGGNSETTESWTRTGYA